MDLGTLNFIQLSSVPSCNSEKTSECHGVQISSTFYWHGMQSKAESAFVCRLIRILTKSNYVTLEVQNYWFVPLFISRYI